MTRPPRWKPALYYAFEAGVILAILAITLKLTLRQLQVPFVYEGDAMHHLMIAKSIIQHGWWWNIPNLAAPSAGLKMIEFPVGGTLDYAFMAILSLFMRAPGLLVNVFFLLAVAASGITATWCLKRLRVGSAVALALGIVFAVLPHIYYRNISHLMLVTYLVPFVGTWSALLAANRWQDLKRWERHVLIAGCVLVGFNYVYTAFFSSFILLSAAVLGYGRSRSRKTLALGAITLSGLLLATGLNLAPTLAAWHHDPETGKFMQSFKSSTEGEIYGLKLRHLIMPRADHFLKPLAKLQGKIDRLPMPLDNENVYARLGMIPSVGFLILLALSVAGYFYSRTEGRELLEGLAGLNLALFLLCTIGSFGAIFNLFISANIRCYNRSSMFFGYFGVACLGILLGRKRIFQDPPEGGRHNLIGIALLAGLVVFGVADQDAASAILNLRPSSEARFDIQKEFMARVEPHLSHGASVYELPFTDYPITPNLNRMRADEPIAAYLLCTRSDLRWSWPVLSIQDQQWNHSLASLPAQALVEKLRGAGFSAIWLNRYGYADDGADLEKGLRGVLGAPIETSSNGQYALYLLSSR